MAQAHLLALVLCSKVMSRVDNGGQGESGQRRRRDRVLLMLLLLAIVIVTAFGVAYLLRRGGPEAPIFAPAGVSVPHYVMTIDGIAEPVAVAATPLGDRVFVAEGKGDRLIRIYDRDGNFLTAFDTRQAPLEWRSPDVLTVGPDDHLYIIDSFQHEVLIYSLDGQYQGTFLPNNDSDFSWFPTGLTFDTKGNLYFTDQSKGQHRVLAFDRSGNQLLWIGVSGKSYGMFLFPTDIVVDDNGWIFVVDSANSRIQVFDSSGEFLNAIYGTDLSLPRAMFQDGDGRLHVLDSLGHQVVGIVLADPPAVEFRYGALGRGLGELYFPNDLARDATGRIYIADRFNNRVQVWAF